MILVTGTTDLLTIVTGAAGTVDVHASWVDNNAGAFTPGRTNTAPISTATTTTVAGGSPGSGVQRNVKMLLVRNAHASVSNAISINHSDGTNVETIWKGTLLPGEQVTWNDTTGWQYLDATGAPKVGSRASLTKMSAASQSAFASGAYLVGSNIMLPGPPSVGSKYRCRFDVTKTAGGTAAPVINVLFGTAATTADATVCGFTFAVQTAVVDTGTYEMLVGFRTVGSGTSAVLQGWCQLRHNLSITGFSTGVSPVVITTGAGFDSTVANSQIGVSVNAGASGVWTVQLVEAEYTP